jgi:peptide/nickel transport system substrate-binding protein
MALAVMPAALAQAAVFKWANDGDVRALDPYTFNETVQNSFLENIYERLIQHGKDLSLQPGLAVSWETTGPDVWRFHLRPKVKWQDGRAFTAEDVVFSFQRISAKNSAKRSQVATVKLAREIDDLTVDFETNGPDPILPSEMTQMDIMSKA